MKKSSQSDVTEWKMTEEERLDYIKKHPIKAAPKKESSFATFVDFKWRSSKGVIGRRGNK